MNKIFIHGNVPSSKNSKQWTGKHLIMSKTCREYIRKHEQEYLLNKDMFRNCLSKQEKPYRIGFYFIRDSRRKFDYINAAQLPLDLMQKYGWIDDDDCHNVIPVFLGYEVDKAKTGMVINILDNC
jgi:hypothetical protein